MAKEVRDFIYKIVNSLDDISKWDIKRCASSSRTLAFTRNRVSISVNYGETGGWALLFFRGKEIVLDDEEEKILCEKLKYRYKKAMEGPSASEENEQIKLIDKLLKDL